MCVMFLFDKEINKKQNLSFECCRVTNEPNLNSERADEKNKKL